MVRLLAKGVVSSGHRATVIAVQQQAHTTVDDDEGVRVIRLPGQGDRPWAPLEDARRLWSMVRHEIATQMVDAVEGADFSMHFAPRDLGIPRVIRMHGGHTFFADASDAPLPVAIRALERRSFHRADHLLAVSRYVAERTRSLLRLGDTPIAVIPNGVDTELLCPSWDREPVRGRIAFVGRYEERKGIRELIGAMPEIVRRCPEAHLVAVGPEAPGDGGRFRRSLISEVDVSVRDRIDLRGPVPNEKVRTLLTEAEVCALPSHMEAHPITWLETLACGKALVASRTGPGPEVVEHGVSGLLTDPFDPAAIAEQVAAVLGSDDLRCTLERGARRRALERFSVHRMVSDTIAYYEQLPALR